MDTVKPGWKTTEFYLHGGMQLISLLVVVGFVNAGDGATLSDSWAKTVGAAVTLIVNLIGFYSYVKSRTAVKVAASTGVAPPGSLSPTSIHGIAGWLIVCAAALCAAPAFAEAPILDAKERAPIITTASTPPYFLPWRAWMHSQLGANQQQPAPQPIIINQPQANPQAPQTDPTVVALLQQQVQLHQQQVFLQQQIASLMTAGISHQAAPVPVAPAVPLFYPAPQGAQPLPAAPAYPVQPLPLAPQYPVQPLPLAPAYPVQPLPQVAPAPVQPLPQAPPFAPQVLPVAPRPQPAPQTLPVMPGASAYNRYTHALASPVK